MLKLYTASWCKSCTALKQVLDNNEIEYIKVDIDLEPDEPRNLNIKAIPTLYNTNTEERRIGLLTLEQIKDFM